MNSVWTKVLLTGIVLFTASVSMTAVLVAATRKVNEHDRKTMDGLSDVTAMGVLLSAITVLVSIIAIIWSKL